MVNVTKTFMPPLSEYHQQLQRIWVTGWITNRGLLVKELEEYIASYLQVSNIVMMTNGTLPLQIGIKALRLQGEIITTPFSYVATTSSIVWQNCKPVFVDIDNEYLSIKYDKIEEAITSKTSAILVTHVFGNPCKVEVINEVAKKYNLKVIYDGAHCFGVRYKGRSIFEYGDVSTCSFHATKLFHTGEGGALFCKPKYFEKMYYHHNFGHNGPEEFHGIGINAKMTEFQAAMGLAVLPYMSEIIFERKKIVDQYNLGLSHLNLQFLKIREQTEWNYSYYPIIFKDEMSLLKVKLALEQRNIYPRRYFYPALNTLPYLKYSKCPVAESVACRILCLPLFYGLSVEKISEIVDEIKKYIC